MTEIPIYSKNGAQVDVLTINDNISHVSGRTSISDSGVYYKGVGCDYKQHATLSPNGHKVIGPSDIFYYGIDVQNEKWLGKYGIFQEKYQPFFSDFIGSCGPKEKQIVENSQRFTRSAVEVVDVVEYDPDNEQMYFVLNYTSPRDSFKDNGSLIELLNLMESLVCVGLNFPWDKASIRDVNQCGYVTDVADMFWSDDPTHKYGTIYSLLYSLYQINYPVYRFFVKYINAKNEKLQELPFVCLKILSSFGYNLEPLKEAKTKEDQYCDLIGNVLMRGRNCAHVENLEHGDRVRAEYINRFLQQLPEGKRGLIEAHG